MVVATKTRLSNEADEEINLYVKVNKTVSLKVRRSETIENLRVLLRHKEGVSEDLQLLEFNGKEICDHSDEKVSFSVETPAEDTIEVEVRCMHTVLDLKKIVESITGFPSDDWDLFHGRARLQKVKTLASYDIQNNDQLKMMPAKFWLMVRIRTGKVVTLLVTQMDTIRVVKEKVFLKTDHQQLVFGGSILEDDKTLAFYGIEEDFTLSDSTR
ncbi:hypothetical protein WN944_026070 [Citrus x changshan-huyou]|uniref:Ubiquitin-like domain-containing protein n=1 Tax=Citrus x changshan-huyou TaxID=2935761 RepID=A0AAP0LSD1_9ROSI